MSDPYELSREEMAALLAVAEANNYSGEAHNPQGFILKKMQPIFRPFAAKSLKRLHKMGLIYKKKGSRDISYFITKEGIRMARSSPFR